MTDEEKKRSFRAYLREEKTKKENCQENTCLAAWVLLFQMQSQEGVRQWGMSLHAGESRQLSRLRTNEC